MPSKLTAHAAKFAASTTIVIRDLLAAKGIVEFDLSEGKVRQVARRLWRDLDRLKNIQGDAVNSNKVAGYWGFWIRKIKPITVAYDPAKSSGKPRDPNAEIPDINEKIAVDFAVAYLINKGKNPAIDHFRTNCKQKCDGKACVQGLARELLLTNSKFGEYLVYSMRYRTFGPHHFVMLLDQMTITACYAENLRTPPSPLP